MDAREIYVERIVEPYTGLPLLGVGGWLPPDCDGSRVEIRYDGQLAAVTIPKLLATENRLHYSTQLPIENDVRQLQVVLTSPERNRNLFQGPLAAVADRSTPEASPASLTRRGLQSLLSGEVFSLSRWQARLERLQARLSHKLLMRRHRPCSPHDAYVARTRLSDAQLDAQRSHRFRRMPTISILMPVFNVEPRWFCAAVESVVNQTYANWELCIADDASTRVDLLAEFDRLPDDSRIKLVRRKANGHICAASNDAASHASGDFIALLDHDDCLAPNALFEIANVLNDDPLADLIYSDEDKIDANDHRYDPQHKPGWSPELILSYNYINHFTVIRRRLFDQVGGFRAGFEGSQDHDLLLRVTERTDRIRHIPKILYHWRSLPSSTASSAGVKTYVHTSGRRAVEEALARRGVKASLTVPAFAQKLGLPVLSLDGPDDGPSVAIIVYGDAEPARQTLQAIQTSTDYKNSIAYLSLENEAETLNRLTAARSEDYLLFLAAGLIPTDRRWLSRLMAYSQIKDVGAVGGRIAPDDAPLSYYFYDEVARNVAALARGILLTARATFEKLGGFDASRYQNSLFVEDYAARLRGCGLRCVHVGDARFEDQRSRDSGVDPSEMRLIQKSDANNPYANPHFLDETFQLVGDQGLIPLAAVRPLRTLVMAHNLNSPEGAPRYLSEIVLGLRDRGAIEPTILSPSDGAGGDVYRHAHVPISVLPGDWRRHIIDAQWSPRTYRHAIRHLTAELLKNKPEVVIANTLLTFPVVEAAARVGTPAIWIIHESYSAEVLARLFPPFARHLCEAAFALVAHVVPASLDTATLFRRCDVRHNIRVIHNGIDPTPIDFYCRRVSRAESRYRLGLDSNKVHIINVGTVCERKGQHALVEAAAILSAKRRDFQCHLVGLREGVPYADYIRQLVRRRGVDDLVNLVPEGSATDWFRAADIFTCTSHMETFSRSILEAEIFGLPIVSTPVHGVGEQVVWNQNALQFPFHDAAALASHLERLIADAGLRRDMGRKSRAVFDNHESLVKMLDRYQSALQQAVGMWENRAVSSPSLRVAA